MLERVPSFRKVVSLLFMVLLIEVLLGQESILKAQNRDSLYNLQVKNQPLRKVLASISKMTGVNFSYSENMIPANRKITFQANHESLTDILRTLGKMAGIQFSLVKGQWVITRTTEIRDYAGRNIKHSYTISGTVRDQGNGETLIGSTVYIPSSATGTVSNAYGFYSLTLPEGTYHLACSFVGYEPLDFEINLTSNISKDISLSHSATLMTEVVVQPDEARDFINLPQMSLENLPASEVEKMPAVMGEGDIIKSLQLLPGIKLHSDGSSYFYVRGGARDQNLILIDEAPVYNPSHLLGLFTTFIPEAVKDIKIYKGDFPASMGDRLSSLIDIKTNDGNKNNYEVRGSSGLIADQLSVEGPLSKGKSSFFISGRRSRLGWMVNRMNPAISGFYFDDINSKVNIKIGARNRLFASVYGGTDDYTESYNGIKWKNLAGTIRWNHIFNNKLFSNTTLYGSRYDYFLNTASNQYWTSQIANLSLKSDFSWFINPGNTFNFGFNFSGHNFNPGNFYLYNQLDTRFPYVSQKHTRELAIYAEEEKKIGENWKIRAGLRLSGWENTGQAIEYKFDSLYNPVDTLRYSPGVPYHNYGTLEPRLGVQYSITQFSSLKASLTHTVQFMQIISNSISPFTTLDVWLPAGPNIRPQFANQYSLGYFQLFPKTGNDFSAELYYRYLGNQVDYVDHAKLLLNPYVESQLRFGTAKAYGAEIMIRHSSARWKGWISYDLSKVLKRTPGINNSKSYPPYYDRPNEITLYFDFSLSPRTDFTADWIFSSGSAFSTPAAYYNYNGYVVPFYSQRDNNRLPAYHRLDISLNFRLNKRPHRFNHSLEFNIYNVYGRENPIYIYFNKIVDSSGKLVVPGNLYSPEMIRISKMYLYNVVPSLTYKYSFQ